MARKKNFDPDMVLSQAVELFWQKGYANTSLTDLVAYIGINRFSLYSTFGDKKNLYLLSLNYYIDHYSIPSLNKLTADNPSMADLEQYFSYFSRLQYKQTSGCFVQNAILELSLVDQEVSDIGKKLYSLILDAFIHVLNSAKSNSEISSSTDVSKVSNFLLLQIQGIRVLGKAKQYEVMDSAVITIFEYIANLKSKT